MGHRLRKPAICLFSTVLLVLTLCSNEAKATASAFARATIDWSSFSVDAPSGSGFVDQFSASEVETTYFPTPGSSGNIDTGTGSPQSGITPDWGDSSFSSSQSGGTITGNASTSSGLLQAQGNVSISTPGEGGQGGGHVVREGVLNIGADGTVTISFDYEMVLTLSTDNDGETAFGDTFIQAGFVPIGLPGGGARAPMIGPLTRSNGADFNETETGTITFSQEFLAGQQLGISVEAGTFARATVEPEDNGDNDIPEPSTALLLLGGLVTLGLLRFRCTAA